MKNILIGFCVCLVIVIITIFSICMITGLDLRYIRIISKVHEMESIIKDNHLYGYSDKIAEEYIYSAIPQCLSTTGSMYYGAKDQAHYEERTQASFVGIGANISKDEDTGYIILNSIYEDSSLLEFGIKQDDYIVEIDGSNTTTLDLDSAIEILRGEENSNVRMKILQSETGNMIDIVATRKNISIPSVILKIVDENVAHISISAFTHKTTDEFNKVIEEVKKLEINKIMLDLRDNTGGYIMSAVDIAGRFIDNTIIGYSKNRNGDVYNFETGDADLDFEVTVHINQNTAAAAEILASALQDNYQSKVIGVRSKGVGFGKALFPLSDGTFLNLVTYQYFTAEGKSLQDYGVVPDILFEE